MASRESLIIFFRGYLVSPAKRSSRTKATSVWRNPTQLTSPRRKRLCSRRPQSTSRTLRSMRRKSPVSAGMEKSQRRFKMR